MAKEIKYIEKSSKTKGTMRIVGRNVYYPNVNSPEVAQLVAQISQRGADIVFAKKWIKINMFKNQTLVKLGEEEFDVEKLSDEEIEEKLVKFYEANYKKANCDVEVKTLE